MHALISSQNKYVFHNGNSRVIFMNAVSFVEFAIQICKNYRTHDNLCHLAIYMTSQIISCYNVPSQSSPTEGELSSVCSRRCL